MFSYVTSGALATSNISSRGERGVLRALIGYLRDPHQDTVHPIDLICNLWLFLTNMKGNGHLMKSSNVILPTY